MADLESIALVGFDAGQLAEVGTFGTERPVEAGEVLYRAGDDRPPFVVMLEGEAEVVRAYDGGDSVVTTRGAGGFLGELNLLTGQRALLTARVTQAGRVLVIEPDAFRQLMGTKPELSDIIFRAFLARRELLRAGDAATAIQIIGSRFSAEAMALRAYANRAKLPHTWIDVEELDDPDGFLASVGALPAGPEGVEAHRLQAFRRAIDRGGQPGRSTADHDEVGVRAGQRPVREAQALRELAG